MSKSTKIIAGLGVAAALGVAALPVATFAAQTTTTYSGQVALSATIADELSITIDGANMTTSGSPASGTAVTFKTNAIGDDPEDPGYVAPSANLAAGKFYKAGNTQIVISTNVPNTYTLQAAGTVLSSDDATIAVAGVDATGDNGLTGGDNGSSYSGASMWGIKVSGVDKNSSAISLSDGTSATVFNGASKYLIGTSATTVDYAAVSSGNIANTYSVEYGLGINAAQSSGEYTGTATYTVTHVKGTE